MSFIGAIRRARERLRSEARKALRELGHEPGREALAEPR